MKNSEKNNVVELRPTNKSSKVENDGLNIQSVFKEFLPITVVAVLFFLGVVGYGLSEFVSALFWIFPALGK